MSDDKQAEVRQRISRQLAQSTVKSATSEAKLVDTQIVEGRGFVGAWLNRFAPKEAEFLYYPYIPLHCNTEVVGDGDLGKTTWLLSLFAAITTGAKIPRINFMPEEPRNIVMFAAEDDRERTLAKRIQALGGDASRIFHVKEMIVLDRKGLKQYEETIADARAVASVLDPLIACFPDGTPMYGQKPRRIIQELHDIAGRQNCAQINVRHTSRSSKVDGQKYAAGGGLDITNAHRSGLYTMWHPDEPGVRCIVHTKHNWSEEGPTLTYRIDKGVFYWLDPERTITSDNGAKATTAIEDAIAMIGHFLAQGPRRSADLDAAAKARGVSAATLRRARETIKVKSRKRNEEWYVELPADFDPYADYSTPDDHVYRGSSD